MPPLRYLRHANGQRGWTVITPSAGTPFDWKISFPATCQREVWLSGLLTCPITPHHCLLEGITVLGLEGPTTNPQPTSLSGKRCAGTPVGNGATGHIHGGGCLCSHSAIQLDGGELTQANGPHFMRLLSRLQSQLK